MRMQLHSLSMQFGVLLSFDSEVLTKHTHSYVGSLTNRVLFSIGHSAFLKRFFLTERETRCTSFLVVWDPLRPEDMHASFGPVERISAKANQRKGKKGVVLGFLRFGFIWLNHPSQPSKDALGGDAFVIILKMERRLNLLPPLEPSCDNDDAHDGFLFRETSLFFELLIS